MKIYFEALRQIFGITLTLILFIILPLVVFTLITSKTEVLGIQSFVVLTGSMEPAISTGGIIFTQKQLSYNTGDVVAFKQGSVNVTHRIVSLENKDGKLLYQTKGDANNTLDSKLVAPDQILGKTMIKANHIGKLIVFLKTIPGFITVLVIPALIFIGFELWGIKKEIEKEIKKKLIKQLSRGVNVTHTRGVVG